MVALKTSVVLLSFCIMLASGQQKKCDDIDTSACKLLEANRPDLCSDPSLSQSACPRYCKLCPTTLIGQDLCQTYLSANQSLCYGIACLWTCKLAVECYDCNATVLDYHECNTTTLCAEGEVCMKKELRSTADGHHEYQMTCERKELCDGVGVVFPFGKRSVESRDLSLTCCSEDFCNYPQPNVVNGCGKDIIFMVDTSNPKIDYVSNQIVTLLFHTVNQLKIGMNDSLVALYTYDIQAQEKFDLMQYTDRFSLLRGLQTTHFHGGFIQSRPDTNDALQFLIQHATTPRSGDRPNYRDVIVFIADSSHAVRTDAALTQHLKNLSKDVVVVGVGPSNGNLEQLATDNNHVFHANSYASLEKDTFRGLAQMLVSCM